MSVFDDSSTLRGSRVSRKAVRAGLATFAGAVTIVGGNVATSVPASANCNNGDQIFIHQAFTPKYQRGEIRSLGRIEGAACNWYKFKVEAKTKVCGAWGCSWHVRGDESGDPRPYNRYDLPAYQDCRTGTHRYKTRTYAYYESSNPNPNPSVTVKNSPEEPEYYCNTGSKG